MGVFNGFGLALVGFLALLGRYFEDCSTEEPAIALIFGIAIMLFFLIRKYFDKRKLR